MTSPVRGDPGRTRPPPGGVRPSFEAINEGGARPPRLRLDLNAGTLWNLPDWSAAPKHDLYAGLAAAGYEGLQAYAPEPAAIAAGLAMTGMARALEPAALDAFAAQHKAWGFQATTLHLGDGFETDAEMDRFAAAILEAQARHAHPLFVETHRATMTQDMRRTLDLVARFPDLRFNADLSHWYTGHELTYGDVQAKIDRLAPVLERVRYLHGRIGTSCAMQAPLGSAETAEALGHFRTLWTRCFQGFLRAASPGDVVVFAPELLPAQVEYAGKTHRLNYARFGPDGQEETDRWREALDLCAIAGQCFAAAGKEPATDHSQH